MRPPLRSVLRILGGCLLAIVAVIGGGWLGLSAGAMLAYVIAALTDRDIAELKDMLIWSSLAGGVVCALAGIWLVSWLAETGRTLQRGILVAIGTATLGGAALMFASFDWPKSSGTPVVDYELRLPAGAPLPDRGNGNLDITVWSGRSGQGCYIDKVRMAGERPEITGTLVLHTTNLQPTMSLRLNRAGEGHWRLPIAVDAALDKTFGPWQRIEFIPTPRTDVPPLPAGAYDIRYRVRKYM